METSPKLDDNIPHDDAALAVIMKTFSNRRQLSNPSRQISIKSSRKNLLSRFHIDKVVPTHKTNGLLD